VAQASSEPSIRAAIFTDTIDEVNGIAYSCKGLIGWIARTNPPLELTLFCLSRRRAPSERDQVRLLRYRPHLAHAMPGYKEHTGGLLPKRRIRRDFEAGRFQVVHILTPGSMANFGRDLARRHGLPLVGTYFTRFPTFFREYASRLLPFKPLVRAFDRYAIARMRKTYSPCDVVLCQAANFLDEVRTFYDGDARVWTTGVDTDRFRPKDTGAGFRRKHGIRARHVGLYVGRVALEKRLDVLVDLKRDLADLDFEILIVGDGPYRKELQDKFDAVFTGYLTGEELADAYAASDFFLFPSDTDAYGIVVMESLAAGVPVVINAASGGSETVEASSGGFVYREYPQLLRHTRRLCEREDERNEMAQRGIDYARQHTWDRSSRELLDLYRELIGKR